MEANSPEVTEVRRKLAFSFVGSLDTGFFQRLLLEMKSWMKLNHTNVLSPFGTTSGFGPSPAMVCPWFDSCPLTPYLEGRNNDLEIQQVQALVCIVACVLKVVVYHMF